MLARLWRDGLAKYSIQVRPGLSVRVSRRFGKILETVDVRRNPPKGRATRALDLQSVPVAHHLGLVEKVSFLLCAISIFSRSHILEAFCSESILSLSMRSQLR